MSRFPTPVFIFSMGRTGSTLLQRILTVHSRVHATGETFLLLPLLFTLREEDQVSIYNSATANKCIRLFLNQSREGRRIYLDGVRETMLHLYASMTPKGITYFVDKTPLYSLVSEEIIELFPKAKFIFLWRNPVSTAVSYVNTLGHGRWNLDQYAMNFRMGIPCLVRASRIAGSRAFQLRFEDLLLNPREKLQALTDYLEIPFEKQMLTDFHRVRFEIGDPTGQTAYQSLSEQPLYKWKEHINNRFRLQQVIRLVRALGSDNLEAMGYNQEHILEELRSHRVGMKGVLPDLLAYGKTCFKLCIFRYLFKKNFAYTRNSYGEFRLG